VQDLDKQEELNLSRSFKIDHEIAEIKRKKYSQELSKLKRKSEKKSKTKVMKKRIETSSSSKKSRKTESRDNKKSELKKKVEKAKIQDDGEKESLFHNILSLNIVENIILRYVVAIISGIIIFGIIFTGLGLISNQ